MENIKNLNEIKNLAEKYANEHFGENKILFDPLFRKEENEYCLSFLVVEFVDESNNDFRYKHPTTWLSLDILTGELISINEENNNTSKQANYDNTSGSKLYDYSNFVLSSYYDWKNKVIEELKRKKENEKKIDDNFLRIDDVNISQSDFVLANIEPILNDIQHELLDKIGNEVNKAYNDYFEYTFDAIRKKYKETKTIDQLLLQNYIQLLNYSWPDYSEVINDFNNI